MAWSTFPGLCLMDDPAVMVSGSDLGSHHVTVCSAGHACGHAWVPLYYTSFTYMARA